MNEETQINKKREEDRDHHSAIQAVTTSCLYNLYIGMYLRRNHGKNLLKSEDIFSLKLHRLFLVFIFLFFLFLPLSFLSKL